MDVNVLLALIWAALGIIPLGIGGVFVYFLFWRNKILVRTIRENGESLSNERFRIKKKRGIHYIVTNKSKIEITKPDESFFSHIGRKSLFAEIIIPDNGEAYFIKPNYNKIQGAVTFDVMDRDVLMWKALEDMEDQQRFQWRNQLLQMMQLSMPIILALIFVIGVFYTHKIVTDSMDKAKQQAAESQARMVELAKLMYGSDYADNLPGGINNPLPVDSGGTTG